MGGIIKRVGGLDERGREISRPIRRLGGFYEYKRELYDIREDNHVIRKAGEATYARERQRAARTSYSKDTDILVRRPRSHLIQLK